MTPHSFQRNLFTTLVVGSLLAVIAISLFGCKPDPAQYVKPTSFFMMQGDNSQIKGCLYFIGKDSTRQLLVIGDSASAINSLWDELEKSNAATDRVWGYYHNLRKAYLELQQKH